PAQYPPRAEDAARLHLREPSAMGPRVRARRHAHRGGLPTCHRAVGARRVEAAAVKNVVNRDGVGKPLLERMYDAIVAWILARRGLALALLGALLVPAFVFTAQYFADIHAELQELLPADAPAVVALKTIHKRLGGKANLTIIATSPDPKQNHAFIDELTDR